jgi:hypothetical protein
LDIFRNRFASIQDIVLVFAACVVPLYSWSILVFFKKMSYWLLFLDAWDLVGIFAYAQAFAFLECAIVLLALVFLGAILPARFLRDRFVAQSSALVFLTSGWLIAQQLGRAQFFLFTPPRTMLLWLSLYLVSVGVSCVLIYRSKRLEKSINSFSERLTVLLYVYVPITFLSVIIVVLRNVTESI